MVRASQWERFLKEQELKAKKRLEKEEEEKKYKERIKEYAEKRKLERGLAVKLEKKLERSERIKLKRKPHLTLKLEDIEKDKSEEAIEEDKEVEKDKSEEDIKKFKKWSRKRDEFILTEKEKETCKEKTLDQLVDEISGSTLVCPPGKEVKKDIGREALTADIKCFRKRVRTKNPKEIAALYDKLLEADPERLCKSEYKKSKNSKKD